MVPCDLLYSHELYYHSSTCDLLYESATQHRSFQKQHLSETGCCKEACWSQHGQAMALQIRVGAASMHAAPNEDPMGTYGGRGVMRTHGDPMGTHGGAMGTHGDPGVHSAGGRII